MKLEEIKPRGIRASADTFYKLKIIGVHTKKTQNQVLNQLLNEEMERLNLKCLD